MRIKYHLKIGEEIRFGWPAPNKRRLIFPHIWKRVKFWFMGEVSILIDCSTGGGKATCYMRSYRGEFYIWKVI